MPDVIPKYYWDSCMYYEHLNRETVSATKKRAVLDLLADNKAKRNIIITSVITDLEVLPDKLSLEHPEREDAYHAQFDGLHMISVEMSANVIRLAREIRNRYFRAVPEGGGYAKIFDLGDAIHLATAIIEGVDQFHTRDDKEDKTKIPLVSFYRWAGEDRICGRYTLNIVSPEADQGEFLD